MRNDKRVEIVNCLKKNTNKNRRFNIDDINKIIYEIENSEFEIKLDDEDYNAKIKTKKRGEHRNANRKTTRDNLAKLVEMGIVKCKERSDSEIRAGGSNEKICFSLDDLGPNWFTDWEFYYNHPISLTHLKALSECVIQLDSIQSETKIELIDTLAACAGENLSENYKTSLLMTNPDYSVILRDCENNGVEEETKSFLQSKWEKGKITYDSCDVIKNLDTIYEDFLLKGDCHEKMQFKLIQYDQKGNRESIDQDRIYKCFPLYVITADRRFWLVSIMDTKNTEWGYHDNLNFTPLDRMDFIKKCEGEEFSLTDFKNIKFSKEEIYKLAMEHQIGGSFFSYETPVYAVIQIKYNERIKAIAFDLIYRSFGEEYYFDTKNSNEKKARIMVRRSPYSVKQWAKVNDEFVEIEGFYNEKGERLKGII